jgi:hypothetical protein
VELAWFDRLTNAGEGDPLLGVVADRLAARQDPEGMARRRSVLSALEDERSALAVLDQDYYVRRTIDRDRYLSLSQMLTSRLDALRQRLEDITLPQIELASFLEPGRLRERWAAADVVERRGLLELAIQEISVNQGTRGRRFEPDGRLVIHWATDRPVDS